jgi:hypothetical protein
VEVVTVSTNAQPSSSQQGINLVFEEQYIGQENSFVVEAVAVDFAARTG